MVNFTPADRSRSKSSRSVWYSAETHTARLRPRPLIAFKCVRFLRRVDESIILLLRFPGTLSASVASLCLHHRLDFWSCAFTAPVNMAGNCRTALDMMCFSPCSAAWSRIHFVTAYLSLRVLQCREGRVTIELGSWVGSGGRGWLSSLGVWVVALCRARSIGPLIVNGRWRDLDMHLYVGIP